MVAVVIRHARYSLLATRYFPVRWFPLLAQRLEVGNQGDNLLVGFGVTALGTEILGDLLRLLLGQTVNVGGRPVRERHTKGALDADLGGKRGVVGVALVQPGV